jgi:hypothetical protein
LVQLAEKVLTCTKGQGGVFSERRSWIRPGLPNGYSKIWNNPFNQDMVQQNQDMLFIPEIIALDCENESKPVTDVSAPKPAPFLA